MSADQVDDVERTRRSFQAFSEGDLEHLQADFSPDITWHVPGRSALAGTYCGIDAVLEYFGQLLERSGGTFSVQLLACGEIAPGMVASHIRTTGDMTAASIDVQAVMLGRRVDGRLVEVWNFPEDQYAMDEAVGPIAISLPDARTPAEPVTT